MSIFSSFRKQNKTADKRPEQDGNKVNLPFADHFSIFNGEAHTGDHYLYNAWVHIALNMLIRNIARADFSIKKRGDEVTSGPLYNLFRRPNPALSRFDRWKETAAWRHIEGEVANINDKSTSLSGKDTGEQHSAFWKYTLIPILRQFEQNSGDRENRRTKRR